MPGAGIPTGSVEFNDENKKDIQDRLDKPNKNTDKDILNFYKKADLPTRDIAIALKEYAPGSTVVKNGWAYKSSGILIIFVS